MVKIDFGVHVDGYIAVAAHTIVVPSAGKHYCVQMFQFEIAHCMQIPQLLLLLSLEFKLML